MRNKWMKSIISLIFFLGIGFMMELPVFASSTVPQVKFTKSPTEYTMSSGIKFDVTCETYTLEESDFCDDNTYEEEDIEACIDDYSFKPFVEKGNYITAGKLIFEFEEDVVSSLFKNGTYVSSSIETKWDEEKDEWDSILNGEDSEFHISISGDATGTWWLDCELNGTSDPSWFWLTGDYAGLWYSVTYNEKNYMLNFPVEIQNDSFIDLGQNNSYLKLAYKATEADRYKGLYIYQNSMENNHISLVLDSYDVQNTGGVAIVPTYSYGATGIGTTQFNADSYMVQGYLLETPLIYMEEPYSFTIKNSKGKEETFTVSLDMPWRLTRNAKEMTPQNIYVDDKLQTDVKKVDVPTGSKVEVVYEVPEGKRLRGITFKHNNDDLKLEYQTEGNSIVFTMPKKEVELQGPEFEDAADTYQISTGVSVIDGQETDFAALKVMNELGAKVSNVTAGEKIEVTPELYSDYRSLPGFTFDHWESDDLTIEHLQSETLTFEMPAKNVSLKAVYRYSGTDVTFGIEGANEDAKISIVRKGAGVFSEPTNADSTTELCRPGEAYYFWIQDPNFEGFRFIGWKGADGQMIEEENSEGVKWITMGTESGKTYTFPTFELNEDSSPVTYIAVFEAKTARIINLGVNDSSMGSAAMAKGETPFESNSVAYDGEEIILTAKASSAKYRFKEWTVSGLPESTNSPFADAGSSETTFTVPVGTGTVTIQAVFEEDPDYESPECDLTKVELLTKEGKLVKQANKSGTTYTIQLSASDMTLEEAGALASGNYLLRLTYSDKAVAGMEGGFKDDSTATWAGGVSNQISKGGSKTFIITAENGTDSNTYTVAITYDDRPILTKGTVRRTSDTEATVTFTSSSTGMYYYEVVDKGAAAPEISTSGVGIQIKTANKANTIDLKLSVGAKDLYIVVKNDDKADDIKISDVLKIEIPEYDSDAAVYEVGVVQTPGGKISVDKTTAREGETVTVTVTPDSGKQMKAGSLKHSQASAPYTVVEIDGSTKQFQMPAYDLSVSCVFEAASAVETTGPRISAFIVKGVNGVINDTAGTISVTLPYGTDLTKLTPTIVLKDAVSVSPSSETTVDLSKTVTYTVTAEDGTARTYQVTAYEEEQPLADKLWEKMLESVGGSTDGSGKKTWWQKAKDSKKDNAYPKYW